MLVFYFEGELHVIQFHSCLESSWRVFLDKSVFRRNYGRLRKSASNQRNLKEANWLGNIHFPLINDGQVTVNVVSSHVTVKPQY